MYFSAIAVFVQDIFSISATDTGVEQLFNTARDICYYCRERIKSEIIQELIIFFCISKFDLEKKKTEQLERFFFQDKIEAVKKEKNKKLEKVEIELISNTEKLDNETDKAIEIEETTENYTESNLPVINTQIYASGRKRKTRKDNAFQYH